MAQLEWMRHQLTRYHRPGWTMTLEPGEHPKGPPIIVVRYTAEDSRNPGHRIDLMARRVLGTQPITDEDRFAQDLRDALLHGVHGHELDETLRRDGKLLNDPHADPARWNCPCGGVGPVREGDAWTCPGCGTTHTRERP